MKEVFVALETAKDEELRRKRRKKKISVLGNVFGPEHKERDLQEEKKRRFKKCSVS